MLLQFDINWYVMYTIYFLTNMMSYYVKDYIVKKNKLLDSNIVRLYSDFNKKRVNRMIVLYFFIMIIRYYSNISVNIKTDFIIIIVFDMIYCNYLHINDVYSIMNYNNVQFLDIKMIKTSENIFSIVQIVILGIIFKNINL